MARFSSTICPLGVSALALGLGLGLVPGCSSEGEERAADPVVEPDMPVPSGNPGLVGDADLSGTGDEISEACLGETRAAENVGLDIFIMLDSSGSMLDPLPLSAAGGLASTKWDAVRQSMEIFVQSPSTQEIGIGLQYFPIIEADAPFSCETNEECGEVAGPCSNSLCTVVETLVSDAGDEIFYTGLAGEELRTCFDDAGCADIGGQCRTMPGQCVVPAGRFAEFPNGQVLPALCATQADCAGLPGTACEVVGLCEDRANLCSFSIGCPPGSGACFGVPAVCENQTRCEVADYASPAVPISNEAGRGPAIVESLREHEPNGLTPTGPALAGALEHARSWAEEHPGRQAVTVLATDGFPTECAPLELPELAAMSAAALAASPSVKTFVIGVFSDLDLGQDGRARLDQLAAAGGTEQAFVINTTQSADVAQDFLDALEVIRTTAVGCEFRLDADAALDFDRVNLKVTTPFAGEQQLFNVPDAAACEEGAWYYERNERGVPVQINVCPEVCAGFTQRDVRVDLEIGCATLIR